jgi:hypothetical protein
MRQRLVAVVLLGFAFACGSDPVNSGSNGGTGGSAGTAGSGVVAGGTSNSGGVGGTTGSGGTAGSGVGGSAGDTSASMAGEAGAPEPVTCDQPSFTDPSLMATAVGQVSVTVHDTHGAPVVGTPVMVCGTNLCSSIDHTQDDGTGSVSAVSSGMIKPALKFGDALEYAELAILLDDPEAGGTFPKLTLPALPAQGDPIVPGATAQSNGVELTLTPNATFELDILPPYDTNDARAFRAAELPPASFPAGLDHGAGLERIFTLAPLGGTFCPPAVLRLPNSAGWDPGTKVEFLIEGLQVAPEPFAPYGEWQSVATGVVDDSGTMLVTKTGGLPIIANVGVRRL